MTADHPGQSVPRIEASRRGRARAVAAAVCGLLAIVVLDVSVFGIWARATILDGSAIAAIAHDVAEEPDVQEALATKLSELVEDHLRLPDVVVDDLPPALAELRPALRAGVDELVERAFRRMLEDPRVPDVLAGLASRAHDAAMQLLSGDGIADGLTVSDGEISLNLLPLISLGLLELDRRGVPGLADVPELDIDDDPAAHIAAVEAAFGRDLPDDFGQLVVYRPDHVGDGGGVVSTAQQLTVVAQRSLWLLLSATVVLVAATIMLARSRLEALLRLGVGVAAAMVLARVAVHDLVENGPELARRPAGRSVIEAVLGNVTPGLLRVSGVVLLLAVGIVVMATSRRGWRHDDLLLVVAVGTGLSVVVLLGLSSWTLLAGLLVAALVVPVDRRLRACETPAPGWSDGRGVLREGAGAVRRRRRQRETSPPACDRRS